MHDIIIIGKGPAGISAALYTVRAGLDTLIIAKGDSVLIKADKIDNYYGFENSVSGRELLKAGERQAERLGASIVDDEVISLKKDEHYVVECTNGEYMAKSVLLSTGKVLKKLNITKLKDFEGKGVSYCSTCDGFFYRNLKVGVIGYGDYAVHEALELEAYTKNITIYSNGFDINASEGYLKRISRFKTNTKKIVKVDGEEFIKRIYFEDGSSEDIDGLFIAYESASSTDFARKLGILTKGDSIVVNDNQHTNLPGLFAAGDCTGGFKQVSTAVGEGAVAGKGIIDYVRAL